MDEGLSGSSRVQFTPEQQAYYDHLTLLPFEIFWRDHQEWLAEKGYMLRPRYRPDWVPSWKGIDDSYVFYEDGITLNHPAIIDATRTVDGETVILKKFSRHREPYEKDITMFLASEPLKSHPRNHSTPIYDVFDVPGEEFSIFVMPVLNDFNAPRFETVGEVLECFRQVLEGLQLLHQCRIAHRDLTFLNIMVDPKHMWPEPYHIMLPSWNRAYTGYVKKPFTRTDRPPKYYIIDFGISRRYSPDDPHPQETLAEGGDRTIPEFQNGHAPHDPFAVDIYCVGSVIRKFILKEYAGCEILEPLVDSMTVTDPKQRPTVGEVVERYHEILKSRHWWQLRARIVSRKEDATERIANQVRWFFRTLGYIFTFKSALPRPRK